ncbi:unnamed protein product [Ectocarpus fasciculatus]
MLSTLRWQGVETPSTAFRDSGRSKGYRKTQRMVLKRVGGCQQSASHSRQFLMFVMSAMVVGIAEGSLLADLPLGFKCAWYDLSHPVQFGPDVRHARQSRLCPAISCRVCLDEREKAGGSDLVRDYASQRRKGRLWHALFGLAGSSLMQKGSGVAEKGKGRIRDLYRVFLLL